MPQIILENFGGLSKDWVIKAGDNLGYRRKPLNQAVYMVNVNPYITQGYLQPGYQLADIDSTDAADVTTSITNLVTGIHNGNIAAYGIGDAKVYKIIGASSSFNDVVDNTPTTPTWPHSISNVSTGFRHDSLVTYLSLGGAQTLCLLYTYNFSTTPGAGRVGRFDITNDSNWGSGNSSDTAYSLTTNDVPNASNTLYVDRPMVLGTNKKIYFGSGYKVDSIDTTVNDASLSTNVLDLPRDLKIKSLAFYKNYLVIACERNVNSSVQLRGQVAIVFWDTTSVSYNEIIYLDDENAGALYSDNGNLYFFSSTGNYGNLQQYNGQDFDVLTQVSSTIPRHGGVDSWRDGLIWGSSTTIYAFTELESGKGKELWQIMSVGSGDINCIKRLSPLNDTIHVAGANYIKKQDTTKYADTAQYQLPIVELPYRSVVTRIECQFHELATGADALIRYLKNYSTSYTNHGTISHGQSALGDATDTDGAVTKKVFTRRIFDASQLAFNIQWGGTNAANQVKLGRIIIDYETPKRRF